MKVLFITGEASGDLHASNLIGSLKKIQPKMKFYGIGGEKMKEAGVEIIYPLDKITVMGFTEILPKLSNLKRAKRQIAIYTKNFDFDFAITVDFPGFNIPIARYLKNKGIPVFYFITPQIWAWGKWRSKSLVKYFKHLFVIYPFEEVFFKKEGIKASFLGNPLVDIVKAESKIKKEELPDGNPLIAILPGSREAEIKRLLPPMLESFKIFRSRHPESKAVVSLYRQAELSLAKKIVKKSGTDIQIFHGKTYDVLEWSDLALVTSGTATIETGLFQVPMVIVYKLSYLSWLISKFLARVEHFGLVNITLSEEAVPELIQREVNPKRINRELEKIYHNREDISKKLKELRSELGKKGIYDRVANKIISMAQ